MASLVPGGATPGNQEGLKTVGHRVIQAKDLKAANFAKGYNKCVPKLVPVSKNLANQLAAHQRPNMFNGVNVRRTCRPFSDIEHANVVVLEPPAG